MVSLFASFALSATCILRATDAFTPPTPRQRLTSTHPLDHLPSAPPLQTASRITSSSTPSVRSIYFFPLNLSSSPFDFVDASSSSPFVDATVHVESIEQKDDNGKVFSPGTKCVISSSSGIKAHQVPKAAYGSFDPTTREFIPQDENNKTRGTSCLVLPEGLRGEVVKVYNVNEWDRAHPIVVKFEAGEDREGGEGFNIPKTFMMHLDVDEIKVLD